MFFDALKCLTKSRRRTNRKKSGYRNLSIENLEDRVLLAADFGDAPDSYHGGLATNAPKHDNLTDTIYLGSVPGDDDPTGHQASNDALGDDNDGTDDEDGVSFVGTLRQGANTQVAITVTTPANTTVELDAFLDFNGDGDFDTDERLTDPGGTQIPGSGTRTFNLDVNVPDTAETGTTFARFG